MTSSALLGILCQPPSTGALIILSVSQVVTFFLWRMFRLIELRIYLTFLAKQVQQAGQAEDPHLLKDLAKAVEAFRSSPRGGPRPTHPR